MQRHNAEYARMMLSDYSEQDAKMYQKNFFLLFGYGGPRPLVPNDISQLLRSDCAQTTTILPGPLWTCVTFDSEREMRIFMVVKDARSGTWDLVLDNSRQLQVPELQNRSFCIKAWSYRRPSSYPQLLQRLPYFSVNQQKTRIYKIEGETEGYSVFPAIFIITDPPPMIRIIDRDMVTLKAYTHDVESENDLYEFAKFGGQCMIVSRILLFHRPLKTSMEDEKDEEEEDEDTTTIAVSFDDIVWPPNFSPDMPLLDKLLFVGDLLDYHRTVGHPNWNDSSNVLLWPDDMYAGTISSHPLAAGRKLHTIILFKQEGAQHLLGTTLVMAADPIYHKVVEPTKEEWIEYCRRQPWALQDAWRPIMNNRRATASMFPPIVQRHDSPIEMENDAIRRSMCTNDIDPTTQFELDFDDDVVTLFNDEVPPRGTCYQRESILSSAAAGQLKYKWVGGIGSGHLDFSSPYYLVLPEKRYLVDAQGVEEVRSSGESLFLIKALGKFNVGYINQFDVEGYHSTQTIYTLIPLTREDLARLGLNYTPKIRNGAADVAMVDEADAMTRARIRRPREEAEDDERNVRSRNEM